MDGGEKCFNEWAEIIQKHIETSEGFKKLKLELEDLKQKEIAKIVGLSESNVRVKIHRIKGKLTKKFQHHDR